VETVFHKEWINYKVCLLTT